MKPQYQEVADRVYYQFVPNHSDLLEDFTAKSKFVFDTFGAGTYAGNPADALLYEVCLKDTDKRGGVSVISSLVPKDKKYSAFGTVQTRKQITDFFKKRMDVKVDIRPTYLESGVNPGNIVSDLLVTAKRSGKDNRKYGWTEFKELQHELRDIIGEPVIKNTWKNETFEINSYNYVQLEDESISYMTDTEGSESVEILGTDEMPLKEETETLFKSQYN